MCVSFQLSGPVLEKVRVRARQTGVSETQLVEHVLDEALKPSDAKTILAIDGVEEEGELVLQREPDEDDDSFRSRTELYGSLFGSYR